MLNITIKKFIDDLAIFSIKPKIFTKIKKHFNFMCALKIEYVNFLSFFITEKKINKPDRINISKQFSKNGV